MRRAPGATPSQCDRRDRRTTVFHSPGSGGAGITKAGVEDSARAETDKGIGAAFALALVAAIALATSFAWLNASKVSCLKCASGQL